MKFLKMLWFFIIILTSFSATAQEKLHLLFTGGIQGYILSDNPARHGDVLRIKKVIEEITHNIDKDERLIFDTGDALAYHYYSRVDSGRTIIQTMIDAGYDGMTVGNLDFSFGWQNLEVLNGLGQQFAIFASNITKNDQTFLTPFAIFQRKGIKIGVVGLVNPGIKSTVPSENWQQLDIRPPLETVQTLVQQLRPQCDIIIAVNHMETNSNLEIAKKVPDIDVIISAPVLDERNDFIQIYSENNNLQTSFVKADGMALSVGHLELSLAKDNGKYRVLQSKLIGFEKTNRVQPEELSEKDNGTVAAIQDKYQQFCQKRFGLKPDEELIETGANFRRNDFILYLLYVLLKSTNSEIAMINHGFFRFGSTQLNEYLTCRDIEKINWSDDQVVIMRLKGQQIKAIARKSGQYSRDSGRYIHFLAIKNYGSKRTGELTIHGKPIQDNEIYAVVTTKFLASGGDGYGAEFKQKWFTKTKFTGTTRLSSDDNGREVFVNDLLIKFLRSPENRPDFNNFEKWLGTSRFLNRSLWKLDFNRMEFGFKLISVTNNQNFTEVKESRVKATARGLLNLNGLGKIGLVRETKTSRWDNSGLLKYDESRINDRPDNATSKWLKNIETNIELETLLDLHLFSSGKKLNPFTSLRFDTEHTFVQRDLYGTLGLSSFTNSYNFFRFGILTRFDLAENNFNAGLELNSRYQLKFGSFTYDPILRLRYLFSNKEPHPGDELYSIDLSNGLEISLTENLKLKPQVDLYLFRGKVIKETATNIQYLVRLSYAKTWKFQYQKFFQGEENTNR